MAAHFVRTHVFHDNFTRAVHLEDDRPLARLLEL
jgi:hypothetical protein